MRYWFKVIFLLNCLLLTSVFSLYSQNIKTEKKEVDKKNKQVVVKKKQSIKKEGKRAIGVPKRPYLDQEFAPKEKEDSYWWMIFKSLIIIGSIVAGFYYFFKFVTKQTGMSLRGEGVVDVMSTVPLGPNKFLQIVDVAGKILVLGVTDNNINLVSEITDKQEIDKIRLESSKADIAKPGGFQEHLSKYIDTVVTKVSDSKKKLEKKTIQNDYDLNYLKKQKDRLKRISGKDKDNE